MISTSPCEPSATDAFGSSALTAGESLPLRLSKSRYMSGLQCPKMLWWMVHEPDAPELAVGDAKQSIFDRGHRVGELARTYVPGGVLIDLPYYEIERRVEATANALAAGAPVIYEASFLEDGVFVAVDILERRPDGFVLMEVKSTLSVKDEHIPDVAVQMSVVRRAGLEVIRAEVMHLNRECRYPDLSNLFVREDVTALAQPALSAVPGEIASLLSALAGPLPDVATGPRCTTPHDCPFVERCRPPRPAHHVSTLCGIRESRLEKIVADGYETLLDLPGKFATSGPARRQLRSVSSGKLVVEGGLSRALASLTPPIAFLDFETVSPAIPVWQGCGPYGQVPVQFSCDVLDSGRLTHHEWLADGPGDPREDFARALIDACSGAATVIAYNAPFEIRCIDGLIAAVPQLALELELLSNRVHDLLPIIRDHVYHPDFGGSFSLKAVLPALVPELGYDDLTICDGGSASVALEGMLFDGEMLSAADRQAIRTALLRYCERDTVALVRLYEWLSLRV